jgi:hypothetical protein
MAISIATSAVLIDLNISVWTARKLDKRVSKEIDINKGTTTNAGNYNKHLLAGSDQLEKIQKLATEIRDWHGRYTLPVMAYKLGQLFDRTEYPEAEDIRNKFRLRYTIMPVPEANDFRVDIAEDIRSEMEREYKQAYTSRVETAMNDAWSRLHTTLEHMVERLSGQDKKIFRDSLVDNAMELTSLLTKLNVTNDPKLEDARKQLEKSLVGVTPEDLRESPVLRQIVVDKVSQIMETI